MSYLKNKEEWWKLVDDNWPDLIDILYRFIGMSDHENIDCKITEEVRAVEIERMKQNRDERLADYFQGAWSNAPNVQGLQSIPGWLRMCDLCSERYVLEEQALRGEEAGG